MDIPQPTSLPTLFPLCKTADLPFQISLLEAGCGMITAGDGWSAKTGVNPRHVIQGLERLQNRAPLGAVLYPTGLEWEPFGELPFLDLVSIYAERALAMEKAGAQLLLLAELDSLGESRAAVLGARQSGLPLLALLTVDEQGRTGQDADLLGAVITLQELGVAAVGFRCTGGRIHTLQLLGKVAPYSTVPLIVSLSAWDKASPLTAEETGEYATQALRAGAGLFAVGEGLGLDHVLAVRRSLDSFTPDQCVIKKDRDTLLLACGDQPFFLSDGHMDFSKPLSCSYDMSEEIINAEDEGCDVLTIRVSSVEDAYNFGLNAHMIRVPVCLLADSEEALESALIYYSGRAMVDSMSEVDSARMGELAKGYGATIV